MSFTETDQIYAAMDSVLGEHSTSESGLNTISIESDHVRQFHAVLGAFRRHLHESEITDEWAAFLRSVKRWFHLYLTTPVEGKSLLPLCPKFEGLERLKQNSQPVTRQLFDDLNINFQNLLQTEQHPFLDQIIDSLPEKYRESGEVENEQEQPYRLGIVVEGRRVSQHVTQWFDTFDIGVPVHVVTPSDLKKESHFDQLILMGSTRWFTLSGSMHVLNSPRANQITFMGFEPFFTPPDSDNFYFFSGSPHIFAAASAQGLVNSPACQTYATCADEEYVEPDREYTEPISTEEIDDIIPTIDSSKVFSSFHQTDNPDESEVATSCHFGGLSANAGVFLNTEASIYRILLRLSNGTRLICNDVEKTPVTALSPGDIVMFSTHGAGDMTAIIANALLGDSAPALREKQAAWKMKVQTRFIRIGSHIELRNKGVLSASDTNFRNWMRPNTIMPENRKEFLKLLLLAGYSEEEAADTIIAMRRISAAHQSAGRKVAQKLRKSVKGTHLNQLERTGMQVLHGKLGTAAEMRAYFIEQIDHREYELPISKLNHPFELTDDLWLA